MRINPTNNSLPSDIKRLDPKGPNGQSASRAEASVANVSTSTDSIQLDSIRELSQVLEQAADVRESVVEDVKLKIQSGEYLTREAAVSTARSILDL
ncbi:flagellar biosynthesis anti-sigma factor FlgM [Stieleria sp. JC731]|uniref:flagellar biosynthesis anti-sigma factor FlgM n=1 Tax=Pirellulaceae TaxID=2691357 RepID=UPI001E418EC7|nr:flagellar biosynthesis anti-sigma factor FlgM [Stieleria sp. JC731]MCC9602044.1 flagellar biosynthesis anti-sigma factor FlgM [Stieleria sp. JC731]